MVNFDGWLSDEGAMTDAEFAVRAWNLVMRKPSVITIKRGSSTIASQTVRVEYDTSEREIQGRDGALTAVRDVVVFGVKGHPTVADTDIQRGDQFTIHGRGFRVTDIVTVMGGIQATGEALS